MKYKGHYPGVSNLVYTLRYTFHWFLLICTVYLIIMLIVLFTLRHTSRFPGHHLSLVRKFTKLPYGSLFFQEGEYFDCGACMHGIWKNAKVVALHCDEKHVYHEECLRNQVQVHSMKYCVLCATPTVLAPCTMRDDEGKLTDSPQ